MTHGFEDKKNNLFEIKDNVNQAQSWKAVFLIAYENTRKKERKKTKSPHETSK